MSVKVGIHSFPKRLERLQSNQSMQGMQLVDMASFLGFSYWDFRGDSPNSWGIRKCNIACLCGFAYFCSALPIKSIPY